MSGGLMDISIAINPASKHVVISMDLNTNERGAFIMIVLCWFFI